MAGRRAPAPPAWLAARVAMVAAVAAVATGLPTPVQALGDGERANRFNDPFLQVTGAIAACPPQPGPMITLAEMRAEAHWRTERGTSCYQAGRCRLPNAYLYDAEIIPRVRRALLADGRFGNTSIWVEGQRRWVWLKGCVTSRAQAAQAEQLVRSLDDVEAVVNELTVPGR